MLLEIRNPRQSHRKPDGQGIGTCRPVMNAQVVVLSRASVRKGDWVFDCKATAVAQLVQCIEGGIDLAGQMAEDSIQTVKVAAGILGTMVVAGLGLPSAVGPDGNSERHHVAHFEMLQNSEGTVPAQNPHRRVIVADRNWTVGLDIAKSAATGRPGPESKHQRLLFGLLAGIEGGSVLRSRSREVRRPLCPC